MNIKYARFLLEETHQNYNLIASDYTRTRSYIPQDIKDLAEYAIKGDMILDSGCANGRLFEVLKNKEIEYFGVDFSEELIEIAKRKYPGVNFQTADCLNLPFPDNFFDKVYSISILHHIPSKSFQIQYLKEIRRVLKPGGLLILRVWDFWKRKESIKLFLKYILLKIIGKSKLDFFDVFIPWKDSNGKVLIERYFHCFRKRELERLVKEVGLGIKKSWRAGRTPGANIYLICEK